MLELFFHVVDVEAVVTVFLVDGSEQRLPVVLFLLHRPLRHLPCLLSLGEEALVDEALRMEAFCDEASHRLVEDLPRQFARQHSRLYDWVAHQPSQVAEDGVGIHLP